MRYEKLLDHVSPKLKNTSRYRGLMLNEKTGAIFPASNWGMKSAKEEKRPYNEHSASLFFMPGNICVLNHVPLATYDLVPFGLCGKFESRKSPKSEFTYIFELFDKYEAYEGMRISMIDGKPLDARLLDDIPYDEKKLTAFKKRYKEIGSVLNTLMRMVHDDDKNLRRHNPRQDNTESRRKILMKAFSNSANESWAQDLASHLNGFKNSLYYKEKDDEKRKNANLRAFDNMVSYDKAALFRALGIVKCPLRNK